MVHGREKDGNADEFAASGYVYKNVFVMFDRRTESLWYPLQEGKWTAISGPRRGEESPIIEETPALTRGELRRKHPNTKVLHGSARILKRGGRP